MCDDTGVQEVKKSSVLLKRHMASKKRMAHMLAILAVLDVITPREGRDLEISYGLILIEKARVADAI